MLVIYNRVDMCCLFCLAIVASEIIMSVCGYRRENEDNADDILSSLSPAYAEREREKKKLSYAQRPYSRA